MKNIVKKAILLILTMTIGLVLVACSGKKEDESQTDAAVSEPEKESIAATEVQETADASANLQIHTETYTKEHVEVQYLQVSGTGSSAEETLNANVKDFYLWQWLYNSGEEPDDNDYHGTATGDCLGNKLLSVKNLMLTMPASGGYPTEEVSGQTFDIATGEPIGALNGAPFTEELVQKFTPVDVPEEVQEKARQALQEYLLGMEEVYNYYLEGALTYVYIPNDVHAEGDYFLFSVADADIADVLAEPIREAIGL